MKAKEIIERCRNSRDQNGAAIIETKEVAVLIRAQLKKHFPRVKFSVRSDHNSVHVNWVDGPCERAVDSVVSGYSFGGFDGMIDLAYHSDNWLLPDGTMTAAACRGTEGSMGTVPAFVTDCPMPRAVLVKYGPQYVFTQRTVTDARYRLLARLVGDKWGLQIDWDKPLWNQRTPNGDYIPSFLRNREKRAWEESREGTDCLV